ncbi:MAG: WD40 repeat protein [Planctomycetota bacterium]|jgi:WD40 repeat protein
MMLSNLTRLASCLALASPPLLANGDTLFELAPQNPHSEHLMGDSIAISDGIAIISAPSTLATLGAAYLFDVHSGERLRRLQGADSVGDDMFGLSVAIDGNLAVVGAPWEDEVGNKAGAAYVFDVSTGDQLAKLLPAPGPQGWFGSAVAIQGDTILVGAPEEASPVFIFDAGTFQQSGVLLPTDSANTGFGRQVALDGDRVVVSSHSRLSASSVNGSAYLFELSTRTELAKVMAPAPYDNAYFGWSVAIHDSIVVVGSVLDFEAAIGSPSSLGALYQYEAADGSFVRKILPPGNVSTWWLGSSLSVDGSTIAAGSATFTGSSLNERTFTYRATTGALIEVFQSQVPNEAFGTGVAMEGTKLIVGSPRHSGAAADSGVARVWCTSCPGSNYCQPSPNSTGAPAQISACGSLGLAQQDFSLVARSMPEHQPYLFFSGTNQVQLPFGDGIQCAGGSITRLHAPRSVTAGTASVLVDLTQAGITAPASWNFQCWYRDPAAGGSGFNLSDGLKADFTP